MYLLDASGAQGGPNFDSSRVGGKGARLQTYVQLKAGDSLRIAVGGMGQKGRFIAGLPDKYGGGGGGGASSIIQMNGSTFEPLLFAGGGGGAGPLDGGPGLVIYPLYPGPIGSGGTGTFLAVAVAAGIIPPGARVIILREKVARPICSVTLGVLQHTMAAGAAGVVAVRVKKAVSTVLPAAAAADSMGGLAVTQGRALRAVLPSHPLIPSRIAFCSKKG